MTIRLDYLLSIWPLHNNYNLPYRIPTKYTKEYSIFCQNFIKKYPNKFKFCCQRDDISPNLVTLATIFLFKKFTTLAAVAKNISFCVWTERPREHRRLVSSVARQRGANRRSRRAAEAGFKVLLIKKVTQKGRRRSYFTEAKL